MPLNRTLHLGTSWGAGPTYGLQDSFNVALSGQAAGTYVLGSLTAPAGCAIVAGLYVTGEPSNVITISDANGNAYDWTSPRVGNINFGALVTYGKSPGAMTACNVSLEIGSNSGGNNTNISGTVAAYGPVFDTSSISNMFDGASFLSGYNGTGGNGIYFSTIHNDTICVGVFLPNSGDFTVDAPYSKIGAANGYIYQVYRKVAGGTITSDNPVTHGDSGFFGGYNDVFRIIA